MAAMARGRAHVLVLAFGMQGHINPLMQLARTLASRGAQVTFLLSEEVASEGSRPPSTPNFTLLTLPGALPSQPPTGDVFTDNVEAMRAMEIPFSDLLPRLQPPASALVYDAFVTWVPRIAHALSIPCLCFFSVNAATGALRYHLPSLASSGVLPFPPDDDKHSPLPKGKVKGLEGLPELLPEDFPIACRSGATNVTFRFLLSISEKIRDASALIINSMEELEAEAIAVWRACKPVFVIGPLLLLSGGPSRLNVKFWPEDDRCLSWLDSQAPSSVLYVSFGSVASFSLLQFQELAMGLDASKQPFLWVVRADSVDVPFESALPDGFREHTKERGMIIAWGPQLLILSHPSVGGFLTHGGWNSIIENISMGSVPMICMPHAAEQHLNRCLVVEQWKIGIRLRHNVDGSISKGDIVQAVHDLFYGNQSTELKNASKKVGDMARMAVAEGGSSHKSLEVLCSFLSINNSL